MIAQILQEQVKGIIRSHRGRDSAITADGLVNLLGAGDRAIRKTIEDLIDDGFPVCSVTEPPAGYFFPSSVEEARVYSKALQKRAVRIFLRRRYIIRSAALYYEPGKQGRLI